MQDILGVVKWFFENLRVLGWGADDDYSGMDILDLVGEKAWFQRVMVRFWARLLQVEGAQRVCGEITYMN